MAERTRDLLPDPSELHLAAEAAVSIPITSSILPPPDFVSNVHATENSTINVAGFTGALAIRRATHVRRVLEDEAGRRA